SEWGPACRFKVDPIAAACPATYLVNDPLNPNFSCGVIRPRTGHVSAQPVTGANRYEFEFSNTADGYLRVVPSANYVRTLGFTLNPLVVGHTYDVRVRASKTNGATWCPWGPVCTVTISGAAAMPPGGERMELEEVLDDFTIWPVPNQGETIDMRLADLPMEEVNMNVLVFDASGRVVHQSTQPVAGPDWRGTISFSQHLVTGTYVMQVVAGEQHWTRRFIVAD
ncbi:MAG TPA: T9SS type A sorting domain-containing protein, partial [Flavobacteriales bacterium]|nr:T9SS type A sorting domain-containing protein [Flavobacteriales bacterium]